MENVLEIETTPLVEHLVNPKCSDETFPFSGFWILEQYQLA